MSPCHISSCDNSARFAQHSHCITRIVGAAPRYQPFAALRFSLFRRLILLYLGLKNGNRLCGGVLYPFPYGDLNFGFAEVAVLFNALHAQQVC